MTTIDQTAQTTMSGDLLIDPKVLAAHPANIRRATGDLTGLKASIEQLGILQPILVVDVADGYQVLAGHRRLAAALELELVEAPIRVLHLGDNSDVLAMVTENVQRKDLTVAEEAGAYLQLQAAGLDVEAIAKQTGMAKDRIANGLTVAGSKAAAAATAKYELTLDQALTIAEFDGDKAAIKTLTVTAQKEPRQFDHVASRLRQDRERQQAYEAAVAKHQTDGVKILKKGTNLGYRPEQANCQLDHLVDAKGKKLTPANHKACPGHAVSIELYPYQSSPSVTYVCTAAAKEGHAYKWGSSGSSSRPKAELSDAERAKASAERKSVIENNKAWKAATPVRLEFVTNTLRAKTPPTGTLRFAVELTAAFPRWVAEANHTILEAITGKPWDYQAGTGAGAMAKKGTEAQLPLALLAGIAAAAETTLANNNRPYETKDTKVRQYLEFLQAAGYALAPVEQLVVGKPTKK